MKKRVLGLILATVMVATALVGCGGAKGSAGTATDGGKVLNIYCWNEEFKSRITSHYPGYEEVDGTTGKIGDVTVVWNITPNADNAYQLFCESKFLSGLGAHQYRHGVHLLVYILHDFGNTLAGNGGVGNAVLAGTLSLEGGNIALQGEEHLGVCLQQIQFSALHSRVHIESQLAIFQGVAVVHGQHIGLIPIDHAQMQDLGGVQNVADLGRIGDLSFPLTNMLHHNS